MTGAVSDPAREALAQRLTEAARTLEVPVDAPVGTLLAELVNRVRSQQDDSEFWLLFVAIAGAFPSAEEFTAFRDAVELSPAATAVLAALRSATDAATRPGALRRRLCVETDAIMVDVNFCARHEHNTGVQRVVRQTVPHWVQAGKPVRLVAWTLDGSALRGLNAVEEDRVLHWHDRRFPPSAEVEKQSSARESDETIIVPWRTRLVLPEVALPEITNALACLAEYSGNRIAMIGHDAIPVISGDTQAAAESERFAHFLSVVKHTDRVCAVSESSAREFRGFVAAIQAQGLRGPTVKAVTLATASPVPAERRQELDQHSHLPLVLCVGSHEPRKNQDAVLFAAHILQREGLRFRMVFVGGGTRAITAQFDRKVRALRKKGFAIESHRGLRDRELWGLYASARFTVFASLHEGFGLPVSESLAFGTPVLTTNYGSLSEIAMSGGALTVDPRSDDAIIAGMRAMLTDDELIHRLRAESEAVPRKTWAQYADELWDEVTA